MNKCTKLNNISHTILAKFTGPLSRWSPGTAKPRHGLPGPWQPYWLTLLENGDSINKSLTSVTQPAKYGGQRSEVKLSIIHNHLTRSRLCVNTNQKFIVVARAFQNVDMLSDFIKGSSMSFYPDFILILSWFYPDFILILSWFYPDFIQILSRFFENSLYPNFILILS